MFAGHDDAASRRWGPAVEARSDGWPLGLQQPPTQPDFSAPMMLPTPSETSASSSDLDTESTGSFFPERSHTLGSLIGIQMHVQSEETSKMLAEEGREAADSDKRRSGGSLRGRVFWCASMLGCGGAGSNPEALGMSPSLAHLLQEERRSDAGPQPRHEEVSAPGLPMMHGNTLFDEQGILPPRASGAPLKRVLGSTDPTSSYPSADWNVFSSSSSSGQPGHCSVSREAAGAPSHACLPALWPGLCGSLAG